MTDDVSAIHADHPHFSPMHRHSKLLSCLSLALFPTTCLATAALEAGYETAAIATTVQPASPLVCPPCKIAGARSFSVPLEKPFPNFRTIHPFLHHSYSTLLSASALPSIHPFIHPSSLPFPSFLSFLPLISRIAFATRDTTPWPAVTDSDIRASHHPLLRPFYQP